MMVLRTSVGSLRMTSRLSGRGGVRQSDDSSKLCSAAVLKTLVRCLGLT